MAGDSDVCARRPFPDRSRMATAILEKPVSDRGKGARRQDTWRKRSRQTRSSARSPCRTSTAAADPRGLAAAHEPRRSAETQGPANRRASDWPISDPALANDRGGRGGRPSIGRGGNSSTRRRQHSAIPARGFGDGKPLGHDYSTQIHYTHGVPKTGATIGERTSLAFRVKPDQQPAKPVGTATSTDNLARIGE